MATFTGGTQYRGYTLRLDVSESSYSTANNTSTVSWSLYIVNGSSRFNANFHYSVTIDGSTRATYNGNVNTTDVGYNQAHLLTSGSYTVTHNSDGAKTVYCSAECSGGGSYGPGTGSCGGNLTLTKIPRAASINSFNGNDIDGNFVVGYTKYVSGWNCYLRLSIQGGAQIDRFLYNTSGETFRLSDAAKDIIYNAVENNDTVNISAVIETWNGSTKVGESSALTNTCTINRNVWVNINGEWKRGIPHVNINGVWKKGIPYIKINGEWKKAI
ncbi:MAG: hypothetical protein J6S67_10820 [Methanobrevibacter sp.]|nr:hypothetical protein [Methanobrevibacter sp.]